MFAAPPEVPPWQASFFGDTEPSVDALAGVVRRPLDSESWIDESTAWLSGADRLLSELVPSITWRCPVVSMYERRLRQPRLSAWFRFDDGDLPEMAVLHEMRAVLSERYRVDFDSIGFNLYRDGHDSVAWHGDRHARVMTDPIVAIVTLGSARPFLLRPLGGGRSRRLVPHAGDLLVMGGACQHRWQHSVPKVRRAGPRLSISFRHGARFDEGRARRAHAGSPPSRPSRSIPSTSASPARSTSSTTAPHGWRSSIDQP
jgi:alkylated DNA repair dioxygenase AlkB